MAHPFAMLLLWLPQQCQEVLDLPWCRCTPRMLMVDPLLAGWPCRLLYGRAIAAQALHPEPVFILGQPRTGTTHLHNLLSLDTQRFAFATTFHAGPPCMRAPSATAAWTQATHYFKVPTAGFHNHAADCHVDCLQHAAHVPVPLPPGFPSSFLWLEPLRWLLSPLLERTRPMDNMALSWDLPAVSSEHACMPRPSWQQALTHDGMTVAPFLGGAS